ncbi:unnamed protein product [Allacma fusca]|uniref:G-protein coupled receptors family 2 profile 2 domain-containing protein n=2 Tax=Allacma fusca TaxID=39272 RepID=A0A8J2LCJ3_9HEXA|nr:unnamed protein product [Allacma fusca]
MYNVDALQRSKTGIAKDLSNETFQIPGHLSEGRIKFAIWLRPRKDSCADEDHAKYFYLSINETLSENFRKSESEFSSNGFFRNGSFYYPPEVFCISRWTESQIVVRLCSKFRKEGSLTLQECGASNHCLPKCCPMNMLLSSSAYSHARCEPRTNNSARVSPILYTKELQRSLALRPVYYFLQLFIPEVAPQPALTLANRDLRPLHYFSQQCARVVEDGTLYYIKEFNLIQVPPTNYCLDGIQFENFQLLLSGEKHPYVFILKDSTNESNAAAFPAWFAAVTFSASIFFLLTLLVHLLLWEEQNIRGWIAMSEFATLFLSHFVFGFNVLVSMGTTTRSFGCVAIAVVRHFAYMSQHCWLTMICLNLYITFRKVAIMNRDETSLGSYMWYAGFGWGAPFAFVTISLILDQIYSYDPCNQVMVPQYGLGNCSIGTAALGPYLLYPLTILLCVNGTLFSVTSYKLHTYSKCARIARKNYNASKNFYKLIAKLFFVMGFTWTIDIIFNVLWKLGLGSETGFWEILSVVTYFQALGVFIIYTCKPSISASLRKRYPMLIPLLSVPEKLMRTLCCKKSNPLELQKNEPQNHENEIYVQA